MGLRQADYPTKTDWTWTDGTPFDYKNWAPKQPDNDHGTEHCAQIYSDYTGKDPTKDNSYRHWNDIPCATTMRAFVCKKAALH
ncbi:lectin C-type domain protein [Ostertagia ostertagi]